MLLFENQHRPRLHKCQTVSVMIKKNLIKKNSSVSFKVGTNTVMHNTCPFWFLHHDSPILTTLQLCIPIGYSVRGHQLHPRAQPHLAFCQMANIYNITRKERFFFLYMEKKKIYFYHYVPEDTWCRKLWYCFMIFKKVYFKEDLLAIIFMLFDHYICHKWSNRACYFIITLLRKPKNTL